VTDERLRRLQRDWDELTIADPLWAILSSPATRHGAWDLPEFLATGQRDVDDLMARAGTLGLPHRHERALDFGCGVGRLTRALGAHFGECVGVDLSSAMLERAREINGDRPNCRFVHNARPDLAIFDDASFDFVLSDIVLQHLPDRATAAVYIGELVRVLRPGGLLVFQMPGNIPFRHRLQVRRRLYAALRSLGITSERLYGRLGLHPIRMIDLPERDAVATVEARGGTVLQTIAEPIGSSSMEDRTYYVTKPERSPAGLSVPASTSP
jgi:SAM-dependent methyltransferase